MRLRVGRREHLLSEGETFETPAGVRTARSPAARVRGACASRCARRAARRRSWAVWRRCRPPARSTAGGSRDRWPPRGSCSTSATRAMRPCRRSAFSGGWRAGWCASRRASTCSSTSGTWPPARGGVRGAGRRARYPQWWKPVYIGVSARPAGGRQGLPPALQGAAAVPPAHDLDDHADGAAERAGGRRRGRPQRARHVDADRDRRRRHARALRLAGYGRPRAAARARPGAAPGAAVEPRWAIARAKDGLEPYAQRLAATSTRAGDGVSAPGRRSTSWWRPRCSGPGQRSSRSPMPTASTAGGPAVMRDGKGAEAADPVADALGLARDLDPAMPPAPPRSPGSATPASRSMKNGRQGSPSPRRRPTGAPSSPDGRSWTPRCRSARPRRRRRRRPPPSP